MNLIARLPSHLAERVCAVHDRQLNPTGEFVLYWMHKALRAHENPALDVALRLSQKLSLPLLVYQGLSERFAYASDRHLARANPAGRRNRGGRVRVDRRGIRIPPGSSRH